MFFFLFNRKFLFGSIERKIFVKKLVFEFLKVKIKIFKYFFIKEEFCGFLFEIVCKCELRS